MDADLLRRGRGRASVVSKGFEGSVLSERRAGRSDAGRKELSEEPKSPRRRPTPAATRKGHALRWVRSVDRRRAAQAEMGLGHRMACRPIGGLRRPRPRTSP